MLAEQYNGVVAGVPHEDVGSAKDAGEVVFVRTDITTDLLTSAYTFTQNTGGVGGSARAGNRFGASVSPFGVLAGAPGEDVGTAKDAGGVFVQTLPTAFGGNGCASKLLTQGKGKALGGTARSGDHLGRFIGTLTGAPARGSQRLDNLAVGAPGKDATKAANTGVAVVWNGKGKGVLKTFGYSGGAMKNQAYGSVFGALTVVPRVLS
ncbi:hypothetical protein [Kineosporia sp. NBRC 101731]|uniref:hypothetical protein n=1 Tax=Kineosporia sp. NBRC 101731 TaxID=3032199 RepID=UPI0024A08400|nr:hypothetical protein [Kineosporia sp. NBRC 101731]GLY28647.1 hypothetical protein Kisp02_20120 [Kineosporia sp. NBRC 101731]